MDDNKNKLEGQEKAIYYVVYGLLFVIPLVMLLIK